MASVKNTTTIKEFQNFIKGVYGKSNSRHFNVDDMLTNIQRFLMRGVKGIRKGNQKKTIDNLLISMSWFMSLMNHYQIDIEDSVWRRFPYLCSYCGGLPCCCKKNKVQSRQKIEIDESKKPQNLKDFQKMFATIYPSNTRTLEHAGIHLAEEIGELSEAVLAYKGKHGDLEFSNIVLEASDLYSCFNGVFNSLDVSIADELSNLFIEDCHKCKKAPCVCTYDEVINFKS